MVPYGWHVWRGETKTRYRFKITKTDKAIPDAGGVYVMVRRTLFFFLKPVYIGKASNLQSRLIGHERWEEARKKGASERHYLCIRSEEKRSRIEEDLIRGYTPKLNNMLVPNSASDAPSNSRLRNGWMSPSEYWALNQKGPAKTKTKPKRKRKPRAYWGKDKKAA